MDEIKKIILVRHGKYDDSTNQDVGLSQVGIEQIHGLLEKLSTFIEKNKTIKIFTSPFIRTTMSAEIIAQGFKVEKITTIYIMGEDDIDEGKIFDFIKSEEAQADIIILVTHAQHVRFFPQFFSFVEWATDREIDKVKPGEAVVIDCLNKKIIELRRL